MWKRLCEFWWELFQAECMLHPKYNSVYKVSSQSQENKRCIGNQVTAVALLAELFFNCKSIPTLKSLPLGPGRIGKKALCIALGSSGSSISYTIRSNNRGWEKNSTNSPSPTQWKLKSSRWGDFGKATIFGKIRYNFFEDSFFLYIMSPWNQSEVLKFRIN